MVEFVDIYHPQPTPAISSVAMHFIDNFIETQIDGYKTLNVTGRETINHEIATLGNSAGMDGDIITGKKLPARVLTIEYQLIAETNKAFQEQFRRLVEFLSVHEGDAEIYFNDDPEIKYYGQLNEMDEIPPGTNAVVSKFTIFCQDPIKYSPSEESTPGRYTRVPFRGMPFYEVVPDIIKLTPLREVHLQDVPNITVTNIRTGRSIILDFIDQQGEEIDTAYGNHLRIDIKNNEISMRHANGEYSGEPVNFVKYLRYEESDFHTFKVRPDDQVMVNSDIFVVSIEMRGEWR